MNSSDVWWKESPQEFERFKSDLLEFKSLKYDVLETKIVVTGLWSVYGETRFIRDYQIRIELPDDFPDSPPKVFEVEGEIPRDPDFHINIKDGNSACLFSRPERYEKCPPGTGIKKFLNGPVKEFFFSQAYYALEKRWPFDEWSHENEGIIEYYAKCLNTGDIRIIESLLYLALEPRFYRQWKCPCGSNIRLIKCHKQQVESLKSILPKDEIKYGLALAKQALDRGQRQVRLRR